jgi:F420-non-reducing hydrogenase iron-sulfur subunit
MSESPQSETQKDGAGLPEAATSWEPRIVAFICNWCTYTGADLAGTSRMKYPPYVRVIKIPCTGRFDPLFMIKAFERGADGVLVSGCHPGDCHYSTGNYHARRKLLAFRDMMTFMGLDPRRLQISWVSAAEGAKWAAVANKITKLAHEVGPFESFSKSSVMVGQHE